MPSPKSGKAGTPVSPAAPTKADEADDSEPGVVEQLKLLQRQLQSGKHGRVKVPAFKPPQFEADEEQKKSWIEIELLDENGQPMPGEPYEIVLPGGGVVASGTLDEKGFARVEGIEPGQGRVRFPSQEDDQWSKG